MKKILTLIFVLFLTTASYSQFDEGAFVISGQSSFSFSSFKSKAKVDGSSFDVGTQSSISFSPAFGYFVADNFVLGAMVDITSETEEEETGFGDAEITTTSLSVGPFLRYYLSKGFFAEASLAVGSSKTTFSVDGDSEEDKGGLFGWGLGLGYAAMISDQVAIEPTLGYASVALKPDGVDGKLVTSGLVIGIGISAYLSK